MKLIDLFLKQGGQYLRDIQPGGMLSPEIQPGMPTETLKGLLGFTPGIGDAISGYDAVQAARQGNYGEAALNALGLLPFVPAMGGVIKNKVDPELLAKLYAEKGIHKSEFYPSDVTVTMSPQDYLRLTYPLEHTKDARETIDEIKSVLTSGGKLHDVPYLSIDKKGKVVSQEGRHRATAMDELGMKEMPVVMTGNSEMRNTLRSMTKEQISEYLRQSLQKIKAQYNPRKTVAWE